MSEAERDAYKARVDTFKEKIKRGRKRNQMQFVAAETVDWWKAADGTPLQDVPFGSFERRRVRSVRRGGGLFRNNSKLVTVISHRRG